MQIIHTLILGFILLFSLTGCGSTNTSKTTQETPDVTKSAHGIFTAGDDQEVLEGKAVTLTASVLDKSKSVQTITWKEDDKILGEGENLNTDALSKGTHTITLEIVDTEGNLYQDHVVVTIKEPSTSNTQPSAKNLNVSTDEDTTSTQLALQGSDNEGDNLTYLLISYPKHGTLSGSYARLQYTPDKDYYGTDTFTYKTNDGTIDSNLATVSIMINPVNDAPAFQETATDKRVKVGETLTIDTGVYDVDGDTITFEVTPNWIQFQDGKLTIIPTEENIGSQHVSLQADDNKGGKSHFEFNLTVEPISKISIRSIDPIILSEDDKEYFGTFHIEEEDNSTQPLYHGERIIYTTSEDPEGFYHGTFSQFSFDPSKYQYLKEDENVTYTITVSAHVDGFIDDEKEFNITIVGKNDSPKFGSYHYPDAIEDSYYEIDLIETLQITDADNSLDELNITANKLPSWLTLKDGKLTGTPTNDDVLERFPTLTIYVNDGINTPTFGSIIKVINTNDAPIAQDDYNSTNEDSAIVFNVLHNDIEVDREDSILLKEVNLTTQKGDISFTADGNVTFSPIGYFDYLKEGEEENVTMVYTIQDEYNSTSQAKVTLTIQGVDDTLSIDHSSTLEQNVSEEGASISGKIIASDADDTIIFEDNNASDGLTIDTSTGAYTYTPPVDMFDYLAKGETTKVEIPIMINGIEQKLSFTIIGENDAPMATADTLNLNENETISFNILDNDTDIDTAPTQWSFFITQPTQGSILQVDQNGNITFQAPNYDDDATHTITFGYTLYDNVVDSNLSSQANITVTVQGEEDNTSLFDAPITLDTGSNTSIQWVELVDLDQDNDLDIFINIQNKGIYWYENDNNTFTIKHTVQSTTQAQVARVFDINDDGFPDILYAKDSLISCINEKNQSFTCQAPVNSGMKADDDIKSITVTDVDGDGVVEILTTSYKEETVNIFKQDTSSSFTYNEDLSDKIEGSITFSSSNLDAKGNLSQANSINTNNSYIVVSGADTIHLYENQNYATFTLLQTANLTASNLLSLSFGLENQEYILGTTLDGELFWYDIDDDQKHSIITLPSVIPYATSADINNDSYSDIITNTNAADGEIIWFKNNQETTPTFTKYIIDSKPNITISKAADLDSDGDIDVVAADSQGKIYIYKNRTP